MTRWIESSVVALALALSAGAARAQDADADGLRDSLDMFPCDGSLVGQSFAPGADAHAVLLFEDQWPSQGDLDFNDLVLSHHLEFRTNALGEVVVIRAVFNALAAGGTYDLGLAWHLPVPRAAVGTVRRTVGGGAPTLLTPSASDSELDVDVLPNIRTLFGGAAGQINSQSTDPGRVGEVLEVEVTLTTPQALSISGAPFDVYIFRSQDRTHEVHRPEYGGSSRMNTALFGTADDGSTPGRRFVDTTGLPFVLQVPALVRWPLEGVGISQLWPDVLGFAASGGASNVDFYATQQVDANSYATGPAPALPLHTIDRSCALQFACNATSDVCVSPVNQIGVAGLFGIACGGAAGPRDFHASPVLSCAAWSVHK